MISIDRYECRKVNRLDKWFAIKGRKEYPMPSCYSDMYDDEHLAIRQVTVEFPSVFGLTEDEATHYQPLLTSPTRSDPKALKKVIKEVPNNE